MSNPSDVVTNLLLVDDQPENLVTLEAILEPLGQNIVKATSGSEALSQLARKEFAAILLDVRMPGMDGFELAMRVRQQEKTRHVPIIFITAFGGDQPLVIRGYAIGAVDYLVKPFEAEVLRSKVGVFVELFKQNEIIQRQAELLRQAKDRELANLRRASEQHYLSLAEAMQQIVWVTDASGRLQYCNGRWFECAGLKSNRSTAQLDWTTVLHPDDYVAFVAEWGEAVRAKRDWEGDFRFGSAKNGYRWHLVRALAVRGPTGEVTSWIGTSTDIEDHRRAEQALLLLSESSKVLASSTDQDATLTKVASLSLPSLGACCVVDLLHDDTPRRVAVAHDPALGDVPPTAARKLAEVLDCSPIGPHAVMQSGRAEVVFEVSEGRGSPVATRRDGESILPKLGLASYMCVPILARDRVVGALTFMNTERGRRYTLSDVRLAEELARRVATALENARLYAVADAERAKLEDANRAKDVFLATLSHELRTPLNAMIGWTQILRSGMLDETKQLRAIQTIERNAKAQAELVAELLDVSRIVTGKLDLESELVDLGSVIESTVDASRPAADAKGVRLDVHVDPAVTDVRGDAMRLQQVVGNLLSNALKFTPAARSIRVKLERVDDRARLTVADEGVGISSEFLPHVFERFRQADFATARVHNGLGLGLAIVKRIVELHGGTVSAASEGRGRGATFVMEIALAAQTSSEVRKAEPRVEPDVPLLPPEAISGLRVLVVEPDPDQRELVDLMLSDYGAKVTTVTSESAALESLATTPYDLLISDIGLPGEDRFAFLRRVRALPGESATISAVALTAYAAPEDAESTMAAGFDAHVAKPVEGLSLAMAVAQVAGRLEPCAASGESIPSSGTAESGTKQSETSPQVHPRAV